MGEPGINIGGHEVPRWAAATALAAAVLVAAGCTAENQSRHAASGTVAEQTAGGLQVLPEFDAAHSQNLLAGTWRYMVGTEQDGQTLKVHHTGEAILTNPNAGHTPDQPNYIPNPPVNLYGTRLAVTHGTDVGLSAHLSDIHGAATLSFHSAPPVRFDERLERQPGIAVTIDGSSATVSVFGASGAQPQSQKLNLGSSSQSADITVAQEGSKVIAAVDGKEASLDGQPFGGAVWFGMDTTGSFEETGLSAFGIHGSHVEPVDMSTYYDNIKALPAGLASAAAAHGHADKLLGSAVDLAALMSDPQYTDFVLQNFNEVETEILAKFQAIEPIDGQYEFAELDALVNFANKHNLALHGHALIFGEAYPQWLHDKLATATPDQARQLMKGYITTIVTRYDGKHGHGEIKYWDVVNEPFDSDNWGQLDQQNIWYKAIGPDYIFDALKFAKEANPKALVGINEWGMETDDGRWNGMVQLLQEAQARGVPVDYVGFQAHFDEDTLNDPDAMDTVLNQGIIAQRFAELAAMGIKVRISEASVAENGSPDMQARVYGLLEKTCLEAKNCIGFNMWGASRTKYYFTTENGDIGDDAPTGQDPKTQKIIFLPAWDQLIKVAANQP